MLATLGLAAWCAGVAVATLFDWAPPATPCLVAGGAILVAGCLGLVTGNRRTAFALVAGLLVLGLGRGAAARHVATPSTVDWYLGADAVVTGRVEAAGAAGSGTPAAARAQRFRLAAGHLRAAGADFEVTGGVEVQARGQQELFDGQEVSVSGHLGPLPRTSPAGVDGYAERLEREGVLAQMSATQVTVRGAPPDVSLARLTGRFRAGLVSAIRARLPEPEATVLLGEVAGIRGPLPGDIDNAMVASGLVHVLAISGIKVAIVAALLQAALLPVLGRRGALVSVAGIGLYAIVGGSTASALRSALMGSLGLVGAVLRRDTEVMRSLLLAAALLLMLRPDLAADLSFQYSFLGVLGIHLFAEGVTRRIAWVPQPFRESAAVTVGAQLATLPLTAHYFHLLPLLSPAANAVVLPTLPPAIAAGIAIAAIHGLGAQASGLVSATLSAAEVPLGLLAFLQARLTLLVARATAAIPGAAISLPAFDAPPTIAYFSALAAGRLGRAARWPRTRWIAAAVLAGAVPLVALSLPDGRLHVTFPAGVDGPLAVIRAPDGAALVVDTGSAAAAFRPAVEAALPAAPALPGLPRRLDGLALSGSTREESGGIAAVSAFTVDATFYPSQLTGAAADAVTGQRAAGGSVMALAPGAMVAWHGLEVVAVPVSTRGAIALEVRLGGTRLLVLSATDAADPPVVPAGAYEVIAVGGGAVVPVLEGVRVPKVVVQVVGAGAARPVARGLVTAAGWRLWQTARDGSLVLDCDERSCRT